MTEAEWLACDDPQRMLAFLRGQASARKLRLFAVACCRRVWPLLTDVRARTVVEAAEAFADGLTTKAELARARRGAREARGHGTATGLDFRSPEWSASWAAEIAANVNAYPEAGLHAEEAAQRASPGPASLQLSCLREVFGPTPFRPVRLGVASLPPAPAAMARTSYETRDFTGLPILADALEDAGCAEADLLGHLRSPGPHVRGCWALDLILGKS
jgi:hypothetical protein